MNLNFQEQTSIGGTRKTFQTTLWTVIEKIQSGDNTYSQLLVGDLLNAYWKPVYCYLRQKGYDNEQAKDLTQGFFQEIVLGRKLIHQADNAKGRFQTFLLTALDRYLTSILRKQTAQKRIPKNKLIQLGNIDPPDLPKAIDGLSSEESFNYTWISELLDQMIADVEAECRTRGMIVHWKAFHMRVLQPIIESNEPPSLADICNKYGIEDGIKASNMIFAVKRRFQASLKRHLRQCVASEAEIDEELVGLTQFLTKKRQYSK